MAQDKRQLDRQAPPGTRSNPPNIRSTPELFKELRRWLLQINNEFMPRLLKLIRIWWIQTRASQLIYHTWGSCTCWCEVDTQTGGELFIRERHSWSYVDLKIIRWHWNKQCASTSCISVRLIRLSTIRKRECTKVFQGLDMWWWKDPGSLLQ
jgi:hypothetical protein